MLTGIQRKSVCYVGGIGKATGDGQAIRPIALLPGKFTLSAERKLPGSKDGWQQVVELGHINRNDVRKVLSAWWGCGFTLYQTILMLQNTVIVSASIPIITQLSLWRK